ncbi:MAG: polysaccharide biosynthesis/export family protein, partial [Fimbriiglobus sp.]
SSGCAALTNPVADGVPVRRVPDEILGRPKADLRPVPLNLLRQKEPDAYRLDKGDVLAIVADEILASPTQQLPIRLPDRDTPEASIGFPVIVREDGTIALPRLDPIPVRGKTVPEAEQLLKDYATGKLGGKKLVQPGGTRITVQLLQRRSYQVLVVREDGGVQNGASRGNSVLGFDRRGAGITLRMQAYENDVLRALNQAGGPPGLDAKNEVTIIRGEYDPTDPNKNVTKIPLRMFPDEPLALSEDDIILDDGDILYIESRDTEVFYSAGLLGAGQFLLPRDYDLRVIEAIAQIRGPLINGGFTQNAFVAQAVNTGLGNPSPSLCTVIRSLPGGHKVPIRVDLNVAFRDPRENILIKPGDMIVLQERTGESLGRYLSQTLRLSSSLAAIRQASLNSTLNSTVP